MTGKVEPRVSRGLRDLLPDQMLARQWMIDTIRGVYELYGFVPLVTPAIEYLDVLRGSSAGHEAQQSIFTVQNPEKEALGLRFDLTVPLARVIAQYRDLPRPFRRYQVSPVWRADKPDKGRFREFTQFDLDSVGVDSEIADTEIMAGMCDTLNALKVGPFRVRYSSAAASSTPCSPSPASPPERGGGRLPRARQARQDRHEEGPPGADRRLRRRLGRPDPRRRPRPRAGGQDRALPRDPRRRPPRGRRPSSATLFAGVEGADARSRLVERISEPPLLPRLRRRPGVARPLDRPRPRLLHRAGLRGRCCSTRRSSARSSAAAATTAW